jgi:hypothetical protein
LRQIQNGINASLLCKVFAGMAAGSISEKIVVEQTAFVSLI